MPDVIVIGGGLAGLMAARELGDQNVSVTVLEARNRLGGRTWYRPFEATDNWVEMGGTWVIPQWQPCMAREIARYGLPLKRRPSGHRAYGVIAGKRLEVGELVPLADRKDLEQAVERLIALARTLSPEAPLLEPPLDLDVSVAHLVRDWHVSPATQEALQSMVINMFGADWTMVSALSLLGWLASSQCSPEALEMADEFFFAQGTAALVQALADSSGATIRLNAPVAAIEQDGTYVSVRTAFREVLRARAVIVALPLNLWSQIVFAPKLHPDKMAVSRQRHAGQASKVWALVQGLPPQFTASGLGPGLVWVGEQEEWPQGRLLVGFGGAPLTLDLADRGQIEKSIQFFWPEARLVACDGHDWVKDPYALGTWLAYRPGQMTEYGAHLRQAEGRCVFAGSDIAVKWTGWMEGALLSGMSAAKEVQQLLL